MREDKSASSFYNLEVYQITYQAAIKVIKNILPKLPKEERFDLDGQLRRSAKAVPRLITEAYPKRYQKKGYQGLLDDATEESSECAVSLSQVKDIYNIEADLCLKLIDTYDKAARQLQNLSLAWGEF
jgi:four helix bundle protein